MELTPIIKELYIAQQRLGNATKMILQQAEQRAVTENAYRMELAKEITKLKAEGVPTTLVPDVARGHTAYLKLERDMADSVYRGTLSSMRAMEVQVSALQTIARYQSDL